MKTNDRETLLKVRVAPKDNQTQSKKRVFVRLGKKSREWLDFRKRWIKHHPPNHEGYYVCYMCGKWVTVKQMQLDHLKSRSRHPELVYDEHNVRPSCSDCNTRKGSKDL